MWKEPYIFCADFLPLTGAAGTAYTQFSFRVGPDHHFEMTRSIYQADDDRINIKMSNGTTGRDIIRESGDIRAVSSKSISTGLVSSNAFSPYVFPIPYIFPASTELIVEASDKSGSDNNLRFTIHGSKMFEGDAPYETRKKREFYDFPVQGSVAAYGKVTKTVTLDTSSGLLISKLTGYAKGAGTIYIQQDKEPWQSRDIHFYNMIGNSQFGNLLPSRKWVPEKSVLSIRFVDLSGSSNDFTVMFHGEKVYV